MSKIWLITGASSGFGLPRRKRKYVESLKQAVRAYAGRHSNRDGLALTPVPGLRMMCVETPPGDLHSVYRPPACLVLQGANHMTVGREQQVFSAGQTAIVSADMPVVGWIVQASRREPYLAIAVELEMALLRELAVQTGGTSRQHPSMMRTLFAEDTEAAVVNCVSPRLMRLLDRPDATPVLRPGAMRELHYWLLSGPHGNARRSLADPDSHASRLAAPAAIFRAEYRSRVSIERLAAAAAAAMSLTAFHKHFKYMTSLTPCQYQKRLLLVEARRLMLNVSFSAIRAAFKVGYESVSQFTREYGRLFRASPKRDVLRARGKSNIVEEHVQETTAGELL